MSHEFELTKEIELAATPEQIWEAIATGPGLDSWFMGRNEIEPGEGGHTRFRMAGERSQSEITGWEPGKRFAYQGETAPDGSFMAFEFLIEGREQGSTVLRMVQSGIISGDWETEFEAMQIGWDLYLSTLAGYLGHFAGRAAEPVAGFRPGAGDPGQAWPVLLRALGLDSAEPEANVRLTPAGLPPIDGVVDIAGLPHFLGVRSGEAFYRFIHSGPERGNVIVLGHHLFEPAAGAEQAWQQWLAHVAFG